jgi:hypothetical protein
MTPQAFQTELFRHLSSRFKELRFPLEQVPDQAGAQLGDTLMLMLPVTPQDQALADLRFLRLRGQCCVQLFLTLFTELAAAPYGELEKAAPALNYYAPIGSYGVFAPKGQFWHKYNFFLRDLDWVDGPQGFAMALLDTLDLLRDQNTRLYPFLLPIASGAAPCPAGHEGALRELLLGKA